MASPVTTDSKQSKPWLFKPGQSGNPAGRPKGSRHALGEDFISALADDFKKHGKAAIEVVRAEKPDVYLNVIAKVVPKEVHHKVDDDYASLSDDELEALLIKRLAAGNAAGNDAAGRGKGAAGKQAPLPN